MRTRRIQVVPRVSRWSEASEDIRALAQAHPRRSACASEDGTAFAGYEPVCRGGAKMTIRAATRLVKRDATNNSSRDDVAAALLLAAGAMSRYLSRPRGRGAYLGLGMSRSHVSRIHSRRWAKVRRAVFIRDGYRCRSCGKASVLECDHIERDPTRDPFDLDNLQTLCRGCHIKKTTKENGTELSPERRDWLTLVNELALK